MCRTDTCHATTDAILPKARKATNLLCLESTKQHPVDQHGSIVHVDRLVGVAFRVEA